MALAKRKGYAFVIKQIDTGLYFARKSNSGYEFADFRDCTLFFDETDAENILRELEKISPKCHVLLVIEEEV